MVNNKFRQATFLPIKRLVNVGIYVRSFWVVLAASLGLLSSVRAQLTVKNNPPFNTGNYLVQNVLLGSGVTASNIQFTGGSMQLGFFNGVNSNLGLDSGVVLSSGDVKDFEPGSFSGNIPPGGSNNDLLNVANSVPPLINQSFTVGGTYDAAILEFDFVPSSDTVRFRYVFGSNEYQTYINSQYNDVFAFFISGPSISGPYTGNAKNIAVVPNSNPPLPITISSVQPALNGQYYVDNPMNTTVALNGFTTVFTAMSPVICGQTYHIKLAIADGSDGALDSGVFLEASSFTSGSVVLSATPSYNSNTGDTVLYEGCGSVDLDFIRAGNLTKTDTIEFTVAGSATHGVDYSNLPTYVIFPPGEDTVSLTFNPFADALIEGMETIVIQIVPDSTGCVVAGGNAITLVVYDPVPLVLSSVNDTMPCVVDSISIVTSVVSGIPSYSYLWGNGATNNSIWVSPTMTTNYYVSVTDGCNNQTVVDTIEVFVPSGSVNLSASAYTLPCPYETIQIGVGVSGGFPPYVEWWSNGAQGSTQNVAPNTTTDYTFFVMDNCAGDTDSVVVTVIVPVFPPITITPSVPDTMYCPGQPVSVQPAVTGGSGNYLYTWDNWLTYDSSLTVSPLVTTTYQIQVTDDCRSDTAASTVEVVVRNYPPVIASIVPDTLLICPGDPVSLSVTASGGSSIYAYQWSGGGGNGTSAIFVPQKPTVYYVTVSDECGNVDTANSVVVISQPDAEFSAEYEENFITYFTNLSAGDSLTYFWDFGDSHSSLLEHPEHEYVPPGIYEVTLYVENSVGCRDSVTHEVEPPAVLWVPTGFSPNGDNINETFHVKGYGIESYSITIFSRWGAVVYTSEDINQEWDGSPKGGGKADSEVYSWTISYTGINKQEYQRVGKLTIIK